MAGRSQKEETRGLAKAAAETDAQYLARAMGRYVDEVRRLQATKTPATARMGIKVDVYGKIESVKLFVEEDFERMENR